MTERRRRDGELNPVDAGAQAAHPRSTKPPGAWTTPPVVVRRPDGSVIDDGEDEAVAGDTGSDRAGSPGPAPQPGRPRPRPRRIPGAPGAVLLTATLSQPVDEREARRRRRTAEIIAGPVPPRRPPGAGDRGARRPRRRRSDTTAPEAATSAAGAGVVETGTPAGASSASRSARPSLRAVGGASRPASSGQNGGAVPPRRGRSAGRRRGARGPSPSRPGERRQQRVLQALSGLNFDRLLPADEAARERRSARMRWISMRLAIVATVVVLIYGVFPVRTWIDQEAATDRARERLEVFQRENELLADEVRDLGTDARIEQEARTMGMVNPGEESYGIMPAPEAPADPPTSTTDTSG